MDNNSLYKVFLWEGAYYGIIAGNVLSIATCLIATVIPLAKIKRMGIVESIDII